MTCKCANGGLHRWWSPRWSLLPFTAAPRVLLCKTLGLIDSVVSATPLT